MKRFDVPAARPDASRLIIGGPPYNANGRGETASRKAIFVCRPERPAQEPACARTILTTLAHRAFRRPVTSADIDPLYVFYQQGRGSADFDGGIQAAIEAMLVSPEFLFRVEHDAPGARTAAAERISDVELASRLSFFLWSSIPDVELLEAAEHGRLKDPAVLERQVCRMLDDRRADALVSNFAGQWLQLRNVETVKPDPQIFPFDEALRQSFVTETRPVRLERVPRGPEPVRSVRGGLHLRQPAAGRALRHSERLRLPVSARDAHRRKPARACSARAAF